MKYHNKKVSSGGEIFDSIKEYERWCELILLEKAGEIIDLQRQVKFILIPEQREEDYITKKGTVKKGKLIERKCVYIADFVYIDNESGEVIVEDVKGYRKGTAYQIFSIKKKLMLFRFGIRVKEV